MNQVNTQFLEIVHVSLQIFEVTCKAFTIERHSDQLLAEKPVVILFPGEIEPAKIFRALDILHSHGFNQLLSLLYKILALPVKLLKQGMNAVKICAKAGVEMSQVLLGDFRFDTVKNVI